ncbi:hypothetical protein SDRG_09410 [Saprolegnia diclina VS20]|uniref:Protein phosphatase 1 regulatory subunit 11 n=1 Tax=Saprolegnia diclina (strain VS20) TaxID=1156394 RepID=T0RKK6_SAPDV|nr:hypothetical protein SDRG_09410 [Saprolegnia diclina VS20]EQC32878.1 hypothetical protein SDRG_09410 [Saprolegnia diclina VS20]|eukprot:XP_008613564.1 hypothetical protein SDRG_09410 [Saprolegnia diclina VS20]
MWPPDTKRRIRLPPHRGIQALAGRRMSTPGVHEVQATAPAGSQTQVATAAHEARAQEVLRLRLAPRAHVSFDDSAVDNEFLGRKKSNKCCIFHKKREFGESSSESEPDSDDSSSSAEARRTKKVLRAKAAPKKKKHMCSAHNCPDTNP